MSARSLATGKSLRAFLIACAVAYGCATSANASDVTMTFRAVTQWDGSGINQSYNGGAGWFKWDTITGLSSPTGTNVFSGVSVAHTFCIELNEHINYNNAYSYVIKTNLSGLPQDSYGTGMGAVKAGYLQRLATLLTSTMGTTYNAPTVQAAIWNIVFATSGNELTYSGSSYLPDISASNVQAVLTAINLLGSTYTATGFFYGLTDEKDANGNNITHFQDQIILVDVGGHSTPPVPVPAGVVLAGVGIGCLGGVNFFRRRKAVVA